MFSHLSTSASIDLLVLFCRDLAKKCLHFSAFAAPNLTYRSYFVATQQKNACVSLHSLLQNLAFCSLNRTFELRSKVLSLENTQNLTYWSYFVTTQQKNACVSLHSLLQNLVFCSLNRTFVENLTN